MQCTAPFILKKLNMEVPCGKCTACRMSRSREWATRIIHEMSYYDNSIFLTLTYDPEHIPIDEAINKNELQRFFKRLRKNIGDRRIKYYASGEYGENNGRPHYHAIIFGMSLSKEDKEIIRSEWPNSKLPDCAFGTVTYQSARYVADYIQKQNKIELYDIRTPPFSMQSQGLGKQWALDNQKQIIQNLKITIFGNEVSIPSYYKKVINNKEFKEALQNKGKEEYIKQLNKYWGNKHKLPPAVEKSMEKTQQDKNLKSRQNIKRKGTL